MRLLADENAGRAVQDAFRRLGHDVSSVIDVLGRRTYDPIIAAYASERKLIVVTHNIKDFASLMGERYKRTLAPVFPSMGLIGIGHVPPRDLPARIEGFRSLLNFEFEYAVATGGRLNVRIHFNKFCTYR